jgi:hypothetical protein
VIAAGTLPRGRSPSRRIRLSPRRIVGEMRRRPVEQQVRHAGRPMALLGDQDFGLAGRRVPRRRIGAAVAFEVVLVAIDEHHHVGVLLDRAGVAEVRQLRPLVGPLLDGAAELALLQHRHVELLASVFRQRVISGKA